MTYISNVPVLNTIKDKGESKVSADQQRNTIAPSVESRPVSSTGDPFFSSIVTEVIENDTKVTMNGNVITIKAGKTETTPGCSFSLNNNSTGVVEVEYQAEFIDVPSVCIIKKSAIPDGDFDKIKFIFIDPSVEDLQVRPDIIQVEIDKAFNSGISKETEDILLKTKILTGEGSVLSGWSSIYTLLNLGGKDLDKQKIIFDGKKHTIRIELGDMVGAGQIFGDDSDKRFEGSKMIYVYLPAGSTFSATLKWKPE